MTYIVEIDDHVKAFKKAHNHILSRFQPIGETRPKAKQVINTWQQVFGVKVIREDSDITYWKALEFRDEQHFTMWLLKWS